MRNPILIVMIFLTCSCITPGTAPTKVYQDDAWWQATMYQADIRFSEYFCSSDRNDPEQIRLYRQPGKRCAADPGMLPTEIVRDRIEPFLQPEPCNDRKGCTCTCRHGTGPDSFSTIRIPADKWESGCVPHEILHTVLYYYDHPCRSDIEHPGDGLYKDAQCNQAN